MNILSGLLPYDVRPRTLEFPCATEALNWIPLMALTIAYAYKSSCSTIWNTKAAVLGNNCPDNIGACRRTATATEGMAYLAEEIVRLSLVPVPRGDIQLLALQALESSTSKWSRFTNDLALLRSEVYE
jgi:hypothetical protein